MSNQLQHAAPPQNVPANAIPFPDELAHLKTINDHLDSALAEAEEHLRQIDKEYTDMKHYMVQYRGEIDPQEMFQNGLGLQRIDRSGVFAAEARDKLVKLKDSPYFARIDFRQEAAKEAESFYIGRFAFTHGHKLLIADWRSPMAGMFYDCEVGPAGYVAPMGPVNGELTRKRQFKIKSGRMEYALENSATIQDDVLQRELSLTSDEKMKSIIGTIQKEQNHIVRNEKAHTLIIQGAAGSGKTSIALHRVAYLLYRFKDRLSAQNIMILSPNKVFGNYISNVLPELGEEPIHGVGLEDIAAQQLEGVIAFEGEEDPAQTQNEGKAKRAAYKSTLEFSKLLEAFIEAMPALIFEPKDYTFGRFTAAADKLKARFLAYRKYPVMHRLRRIAEDMCRTFEGGILFQEDVPKVAPILKELKGMLKIKNTLALYRAFFSHSGIPNLFAMGAKNTLEWADVFPFLSIRAAFEGLRETATVQHLVIDEMQDYTPVQYAALNLLFKCPKTILGDFGQSIHTNYRYTLEDLRCMYSGAEFAQLSKSYRSTYEIVTFAKKILPGQSIEPVERHGQPPAIIRCLDGHDQLARLRSEIDHFMKGDHASLGIVAKTNRDAKELHDALSADYETHLLSPDSTRFVNGISITSIQMAKGLEFDQVILPYASSGQYHTEHDRNLLYVACTRAMHQLTILYTDELSPLIKP